VAQKKPTHFDYDLVIIGTGAGGGVAAHIAIAKGKKVAVIESNKIGGECPNFGCVPTKALLRAAEIYREAEEEAPHFGVRTTNVGFNWQAIKRWKDTAVERTGTAEGNRAFAAEGIAVIKGRAHFISPYEVSVGHQRISGRKFLIATGTHDVIPPIEGIKEAGYITYKEAIELPKLPKSLFIVGGGAIGTEFTHLFASLGVEVIQAEFAPRILAREEPEASELLQALFERRGITVLPGTQVVKVEVDKSKKVVTYIKDGVADSVRVDEIMIAAGKAANVDLGLENAGVEFDKRGVKTNDMMQTSAEHIYAAGDVVGPYAFTHMASYQSRIAAHNMFHREKVVARYHAVPRCVFTDPEIASVGITEQEARDKGMKIKVNAVPTSIIGRANTSNQTAGFVKVITTKSGVLIGGCIVAPRAGEMMHELALAVHNGLKAEDVAATIHAFPTWSEAVRIACAGIK
jgi:dihydrolipoamide dehydrogenase